MHVFASRSELVTCLDNVWGLKVPIHVLACNAFFSLDGQIDAQSDFFSVVKSTIHTDLHIVHSYRECHTKARVIYNVLVTKYDFHSIVKIPGKQ